MGKTEADASLEKINSHIPEGMDESGPADTSTKIQNVATPSVGDQKISIDRKPRGANGLVDEDKKTEQPVGFDNQPPEAPALLHNRNDVRVSQPGAWVVHPTRPIDNDHDSSSYSSTGDEEISTATNTMTAAAVNENDEYLITAELVDENPAMVDAQILDQVEEAKIKRLRKRIRWTFVTVVLILILVVVISLSATLPGNDNGSDQGNATQTQTILASSSPTLSFMPSPSSSILSSRHPSEVPSQAPTTLIWKEVQRLDGFSVDGLPFGPATISGGGQRFGNTVHISNIAETRLGNRTGREFLVVGSYGGGAFYIDGFGGPARFATLGPAVYLCGGNDKVDGDFCSLQTILEDMAITVASDLTGMYLVFSKDFLSGDLYDLSYIDSYNTTHVPNPILSALFEPDPYRSSVAVTASASRIISMTTLEQRTLTVNISSPTDPIAVVDETVDILADNTTDFFSMALRGNTLVTIHGLGNEPMLESTSTLLDDFPYDAYSIHRKDILLFDTALPLAAGEGTSLFSRKGLAVNGDASIVAVSSAAFPSLDFQINVFQFMNGTTWEPMGSTIFGSSPGDYFGEALAMNLKGDFLVVGAPADGTQGTGSGRVYSYVWDGEDWMPFGNPLDGVAGSNFGSSFDMSDDGTLLLVGAPGGDTNGQDSGEVAIFELSGV